MTTNAERLKKTNATYARGLRREAKVIEALIKHGWDVTPSSQDENRTQDIDAWRTLNVGNGKAKLAISIKSLSAATFSKSQSLLFELYVLDRWSMSWFPSWFHNGRANAYIFEIGGHGLYYISKAKLEAYVNAKGFDRTVQNSPAVIYDQYVTGHTHLDAQSGLIKLSKLIKAGVAYRIDIKA